MKIKITDNSGKVEKEFEEAVLRALTKCGMTAEGYAKKICPVDTGRLRNSITNTVVENEKAAYIGTNVEYAPHVELGTKRTKSQPYLKPSVADHAQTYRKIINDELKG